MGSGNTERVLGKFKKLILMKYFFCFFVLSFNCTVFCQQIELSSKIDFPPTKGWKLIAGVSGEIVGRISSSNSMGNEDWTIILSLFSGKEITIPWCYCSPINDIIVDEGREKIITLTAAHPKTVKAPTNIDSQSYYLRIYDTNGNETFVSKQPVLVGFWYQMIVGDEGDIYLSGYDRDQENKIISKYDYSGNQVWKKKLRSQEFNIAKLYKSKNIEELILLQSKKVGTEEITNQISVFDSKGNELFTTNNRIKNNSLFFINEKLYTLSKNKIIDLTQKDGSISYTHNNATVIGLAPSESKDEFILLDDNLNLFRLKSTEGYFEVNKLNNSLASVERTKSFNLIRFESPNIVELISNDNIVKYTVSY